MDGPSEPRPGHDWAPPELRSRPAMASVHIRTRSPCSLRHRGRRGLLRRRARSCVEPYGRPSATRFWLCQAASWPRVDRLGSPPEPGHLAYFQAEWKRTMWALSHIMRGERRRRADPHLEAGVLGRFRVTLEAMARSCLVLFRAWIVAAVAVAAGCGVPDIKNTATDAGTAAGPSGGGAGATGTGDGGTSTGATAGGGAATAGADAGPPPDGTCISNDDCRELRQGQYLRPRVRRGWSCWSGAGGRRRR